MQAFLSYWLTQRPTSRRSGWLAQCGGALLVVAMVAMSPLRQPVPRRPGQALAAGQFLRAVLRADYQGAYARLAPEVRQAINFGQFEQAAQSIWKNGQRHGRGIELYKLGVRLGDGRASRLFYAFSFAADSSLQAPSILLEVTFRDTASRAVLGFGVRAGQAQQLPRNTPAGKTTHKRK
ncbi:hypothetical protein [Hymenobacter rubidus]|uniref:hypothetical protein n=1 Tax=Hymenobacter rubidus TaxID=1441626 RepID=UPI00191CB3F4|nr:hypothetical protein [Hymenobacter rubidus]